MTRTYHSNMVSPHYTLGQQDALAFYKVSGYGDALKRHLRAGALTAATALSPTPAAVGLGGTAGLAGAGLLGHQELAQRELATAAHGAQDAVQRQIARGAVSPQSLQQFEQQHQRKLRMEQHLRDAFRRSTGQPLHAGLIPTETFLPHP